MTGKAVGNGTGQLRAAVRMVFTALTICWLGAACSPRQISLPATPSESEVGIPTPAASALRATRTVTSEPTGWIRHDAREFVISLPEGWRILSEDESLRAAYIKFTEETGAGGAHNRVLAGFLGAEAGLLDAVFWAFAADAQEQPVVESLNIRRTALGSDAAADPAVLVGPILEQYRLLSVEVTEVRAGFEIDEHAAAMVAYRLPVADGEDGPIHASGRQYFVVAGDLWILTYTAGSDRESALAGLADRSARSFQVR